MRLPRIALPLDTDVTPACRGASSPEGTAAERWPREKDRAARLDRTARGSLRLAQRLRKSSRRTVRNRPLTICFTGTGPHRPSRGLRELQPETEADDAGEPDDAHQHGVTVEVLLRDGGTSQAGGDAAAEHAGH